MRALLAGLAFAGAVLPPVPALAGQPADVPPASAPPAAVAEAGAPATLTQALVLAYNYNATLQAQRAALRQADEGVPTALAGWRPTLSLVGSYGRTSENLTQQITQGGLIRDTTSPQNYNQSTAQAQVTENVFNGGKTVAQTREAKNHVYAARAQLIATEGQVFLQVVQAYVAVVTDQQLLALQQNYEQVSAQQLKDTQTQFNVGEITMTSVAQAQASLAQAVEQVQIAQGNLKIARENFRQLVGVYPAETLAPPQPLMLPVHSKTQTASTAMANNPNVIAADFNHAADQDAIDVAFSALMPQLQVQASAYHEVGQSYVGSQLKGGSIIGQLTIPLYQGGQEYAAIRQARAKAQQSFASIIDAQRAAYEQGSQAWETVISTRAAIVATNAAIKANAIALDGVEREQLVGTRTTFDVLQQQQILLNSQVQQVQNIGTLVNNSYTVAEAIGRLTARDLGLPVQEYDDLKYYDAVKNSLFGTGESADHDAGVSPDGMLLTAAQAPAAASGAANGPAP